MKLYFLRHGIAEDAGPTLTDAQRALTPHGIERLKASAAAMKALGIQPALIYSSPLVRARQTAEIVAAALNVAVQVQAEVGPGFNPRIVEALVGDGDPMFVGHEPDMSATISALIGGGAITMKKGSLARLDAYSVAPLRCALTWLIAPTVFIHGESDERD